MAEQKIVSAKYGKQKSLIPLGNLTRPLFLTKNFCVGTEIKVVHNRVLNMLDLDNLPLEIELQQIQLFAKKKSLI